MKIHAIVFHIIFSDQLTSNQEATLPGFQAARVSCRLVQEKTSKPSSELDKTHSQL